MGPRIKYISSNNNRRSITLYDKSSNEPSILKSYTSSSVRAQQEQVQKMRSDLLVKERKILQDLSNLKNAPLPKPIKIPNFNSLEVEDYTILPSDINENVAFSHIEEPPSFMKSPIIIKESLITNFDEDSFEIFDQSGVFENQSVNPKNERFDANRTPPPTSSSPTKINSDQSINEIKEESNKKNSSSIASPESENSNYELHPQSEIEFFTIDPEFLASFAGIWRRKLDRPVQPVRPESPDHFEQIPMKSKGAPKLRKNKK